MAVSSGTWWAGLTQRHEVPSLLMETLQEDTPTPKPPDIISLSGRLLLMSWAEGERGG